jgi:hypothetical protein
MGTDVTDSFTFDFRRQRTASHAVLRKSAKRDTAAKRGAVKLPETPIPLVSIFQLLVAN